MPFNVNLPANNSVISSAELRDQFNGLRDELDDRCDSVADSRPDEARVGELINEQAAGIVGPQVSPLTLTVSDPPTQSEVQAIVDAYNLLLGAVRREF